MRVSPLNLINYNSQITTNKNNSNNNIKLQSPLACDTVQFSGAVKVLTDKQDKAFVNILAQELELDTQSTKKLKDTVWNFLREKRIRSLGEIGGEDYFDEQLELHEKIMDAVSIPDDLSEYLASEIIHRCDEGKEYIPLGLKRYEKGLVIEKIYSGEISMNNGAIDLIEQEHDDAFYKYVSKILRLTPDQAYDFRATVDEYLEENKLKSITELFSSEDLFNEQAVLTERLEQKFDLSEKQTTMLNIEFLNRANTSDRENYEPITNPYVSDVIPFRKIISDGEYNYEIGNKDFSLYLYEIMTEEAFNKGYESLFDIFNPENKLEQSEAYKFIMESELSQEDKLELILDFVKASENHLEMEETLPKHPDKDEYYANMQSLMIAEQIIETFDLDSYLIDIDNNEHPIMEDIIKIYPEHVKGGENSAPRKVAFLIAEKYNLPGGADKTIEKIIKEVLAGGTKKTDEFVINKILG